MGRNAPVIHATKKPVTIQAMQVTDEDSVLDITAWVLSYGGLAHVGADRLSLDVVTLEGTMTAIKNAYVIRGVKGEFYPCREDIFEATYDVIDREYT